MGEPTLKDIERAFNLMEDKELRNIDPTASESKWIEELFTRIQASTGGLSPRSTKIGRQLAAIFPKEYDEWVESAASGGNIAPYGLRWANLDTDVAETGFVFDTVEEAMQAGLDGLRLHPHSAEWSKIYPLIRVDGLCVQSDTEPVLFASVDKAESNTATPSIEEVVKVIVDEDKHRSRLIDRYKEDKTSG